MEASDKIISSAIPRRVPGLYVRKPTVLPNDFAGSFQSWALDVEDCQSHSSDCSLLIAIHRSCRRALAGVATAQQAPFPYGRCAYSPGKSNYFIKSYRLDGDNGICWTIGYSETCYRNDDPCCNRDLYKVMLDTRKCTARGSCVPRRLSVAVCLAPLAALIQVSLTM